MRKISFIFILFFCLKVPSFPANLVNHCGFETGDSAESVSHTGTFSIETTTVRSGTYALQVNPTGSNTGSNIFYAMDGTGSQVVTQQTSSMTYVDFYFQYSTKPASVNEEFFVAIDTNSAQKASLRLNSLGNIVIYFKGTTSTSTGTAVLQGGIWYEVEFKFGTGTNCIYEVDVATDGFTPVLDSSGTNGNATFAATGGVGWGKGTNRNGKGIGWFFDDVDWSTSSFTGAHQISFLTPNTTGHYSNFSVVPTTATRWAATNDLPPNGNGSYVGSNVFTDEETEALTDGCNIISGTVNAVKSIHDAANGGGGTGIFTLVLRSNTTDNTFGSAGTLSTYQIWAKEYNQDPATGVAWTLSSLDSVETGGQEGDADGFTHSRFTNTGIMIDYSPSGSNPCGGVATPILPVGLIRYLN